MNDVILITGGTDGYGKAAAKRFAEAGCRVVITGRRKDALALAAEETGAIPFAADATLPEDWERLGKFIREKFGRLDLLVNNAGGGVAIKETADLSVDEIDRAIKLNLNSAIYGCREFAPMFLSQNAEPSSTSPRYAQRRHGLAGASTRRRNGAFSASRRVSRPSSRRTASE